MTVFLQFLNQIYTTFFLNFLFKKKYDYFSGLKVFKRKIYNELNYKGLVRFLIFYCIKNNLKIKEIPIKHKKELMEILIMFYKEVIYY